MARQIGHSQATLKRYLMKHADMLMMALANPDSSDETTALAAAQISLVAEQLYGPNVMCEQVCKAREMERWLSEGLCPECGASKNKMLAFCAACTVRVTEQFAKEELAKFAPLGKAH